MDGFMYINCEDLQWNYNHWWENTGEGSESVLLETFSSFGLAGLPISEIWTSGSNRVRDRKADDNDGLYAEFGTDEPLCFCFSGTPRCLEIYADGFEVSPSKYSMRSPNYPKIYHEQNRCWSYIFTDPILASCLGKCIVGMEFADVYEKRWHDRCMILRLDDGTGISMCGHISMLVQLIDSDHHVIIRKGE